MPQTPYASFSEESLTWDAGDKKKHSKCLYHSTYISTNRQKYVVDHQLMKDIIDDVGRTRTYAPEGN
jgi:hypothetical protein